MLKDKGIADKVTKAWALKDIWVNLNGTELCDIDVTDFECIYGGCQVPAKLQFIDSRGITTGDVKDTANIAVGGFVDIGWITSDGCEHEDSYVITKVRTETNSKNQKLVNIDLEDLETRNLKGSFLSKGYPSKKFTEAVSSHFKELKNDLLPNAKDLSVIGPKIEKAMNMVVPGHLNFHDFLNIEMKERGFSYIKDRAMSYLVHDEFREFGRLLHTGNVFEFDASSVFDFNRIVQFDLDGFNAESFLCSLPSSDTSMNLIDGNAPDAVKNMKGIDSKISRKEAKDSKNDVTFSGVKTSDMVLGRGKKQGERLGKDRQYFSTLSNAQKCSIWVPGRNDNLVGKKVTAIFPKPSYYSKTSSDDLFTGDWEVQFVRDKIIGAYFMQELILRRPGGDNK